MRLTELQRAQIRSLIRHDTLRRTVRAPALINTYERETQGANPWQTRSATGQDADAAQDTRPLAH